MDAVDLQPEARVQAVAEVQVVAPRTVEAKLSRRLDGPRVEHRRLRRDEDLGALSEGPLTPCAGSDGLVGAADAQHRPGLRAEPQRLEHVGGDEVLPALPRGTLGPRE